MEIQAKRAWMRAKVESFARQSDPDAIAGLRVACLTDGDTFNGWTCRKSLLWRGRASCKGIYVDALLTIALSPCGCNERTWFHELGHHVTLSDVNLWRVARDVFRAIRHELPHSCYNPEEMLAWMYATALLERNGAFRVNRLWVDGGGYGRVADRWGARKGA